jgi:hypothetical protein
MDKILYTRITPPHLQNLVYPLVGQGIVPGRFFVGTEDLYYILKRMDDLVDILKKGDTIGRYESDN